MEKISWYSYVFKALKVAGVVLTGYELSEIFDDGSEGKAALELATQLGKELVKRSEQDLEQREMIKEIQITICGVAVLSLAAILIGIVVSICNLLKRCSTKVIKKAIDESIDA